MSIVEATVKNMFEKGHSLAWPYLEKFEYPWQILPSIGSIILEIGKTLPVSEYNRVGENIWVAKSAKIASSASISGPAIIGKNSELRQGAFVRGNALVGNDCTVGNSVELKNCILFDHVQVPHFNYVGDSVLGFYAHMGAGSITSNVKSDNSAVVVKSSESCVETGLIKFGAILADHVEVGCNSVLNPGTVVCKNSRIYPLSSVRGIVPANKIFKSKHDFSLVDIKG